MMATHKIVFQDVFEVVQISIDGEMVDVVRNDERYYEKLDPLMQK